MRKVIRRNLERSGKGVHVAGGVNAVVAATVDEPAATTSVKSTQRIVQRGRHHGREEHA